ncbi:hypothetical protein [Streptomyces sp. NBC_01500]|uniref:hypothetical protein n=1 Tax=Streptomyces sp. NBC_01500 TaxID=2903886 RepID=UPI00224FEDA5|nr:hypothetical protein [Streptomyces sp. NBC_01500]
MVPETLIDGEWDFQPTDQPTDQRTDQRTEGTGEAVPGRHLPLVRGFPYCELIFGESVAGGSRFCQSADVRWRESKDLILRGNHADR